MNNKLRFKKRLLTAASALALTTVVSGVAFAAVDIVSDSTAAVFTAAETEYTVQSGTVKLDFAFPDQGTNPAPVTLNVDGTIDHYDDATPAAITGNGIVAQAGLNLNINSGAVLKIGTKGIVSGSGALNLIHDSTATTEVHGNIVGSSLADVITLNNGTLELRGSKLINLYAGNDVITVGSNAKITWKDAEVDTTAQTLTGATAEGGLNLGEGDDSLTVTSTSIDLNDNANGKIDIDLGDGNDTLTFTDVDAVLSGSIYGGNGDDKVELSGKTLILGAQTTVTDSTVTVATTGSEGDLDLGIGNNNLSLTNGVTITANNIKFDAGNDVVTIDDATITLRVDEATKGSLDLGAGVNSLTANKLTLTGKEILALGTAAGEDNTLSFKDSTITLKGRLLDANGDLLQTAGSKDVDTADLAKVELGSGNDDVSLTGTTKVTVGYGLAGTNIVDDKSIAGGLFDLGDGDDQLTIADTAKLELLDAVVGARATLAITPADAPANASKLDLGEGTDTVSVTSTTDNALSVQTIVGGEGKKILDFQGGSIRIGTDTVAGGDIDFKNASSVAINIAGATAGKDVTVTGTIIGSADNNTGEGSDLSITISNEADLNIGTVISGDDATAANNETYSQDGIILSNGVNEITLSGTGELLTTSIKANSGIGVAGNDDVSVAKNYSDNIKITGDGGITVSREAPLTAIVPNATAALATADNEADAVVILGQTGFVASATDQFTETPKALANIEISGKGNLRTSGNLTLQGIYDASVFDDANYQAGIKKPTVDGGQANVIRLSGAGNLIVKDSADDGTTDAGVAKIDIKGSALIELTGTGKIYASGTPNSGGTRTPAITIEGSSNLTSKIVVGEDSQIVAAIGDGAALATNLATVQTSIDGTAGAVTLLEAYENNNAAVVVDVKDTLAKIEALKVKIDKLATAAKAADDAANALDTGTTNKANITGITGAIKTKISDLQGQGTTLTNLANSVNLAKTTNSTLLKTDIDALQATEAALKSAIDDVKTETVKVPAGVTNTQDGVQAVLDAITKLDTDADEIVALEINDFKAAADKASADAATALLSVAPLSAAINTAEGLITGATGGPGDNIAVAVEVKKKVDFYIANNLPVALGKEANGTITVANTAVVALADDSRVIFTKDMTIGVRKAYDANDKTNLQTIFKPISGNLTIGVADGATVTIEDDLSYLFGTVELVNKYDLFEGGKIIVEDNAIKRNFINSLYFNSAVDETYAGTVLLKGDTNIVKTAVTAVGGTRNATFSYIKTVEIAADKELAMNETVENAIQTIVLQAGTGSTTDTSAVAGYEGKTVLYLGAAKPDAVNRGYLVADNDTTKKNIQLTQNLTGGTNTALVIGTGLDDATKVTTEVVSNSIIDGVAKIDIKDYSDMIVAGGELKNIDTVNVGDKSTFTINGGKIISLANINLTGDIDKLSVFSIMTDSNISENQLTISGTENSTIDIDASVYLNTTISNVGTVTIEGNKAFASSGKVTLNEVTDILTTGLSASGLKTSYEAAEADHNLNLVILSSSAGSVSDTATEIGTLDVKEGSILVAKNNIASTNLKLSGGLVVANGAIISVTGDGSDGKEGLTIAKGAAIGFEVANIDNIYNVGKIATTTVDSLVATDIVLKSAVTETGAIIADDKTLELFTFSNGITIADAKLLSDNIKADSLAGFNIEVNNVVASDTVTAINVAVKAKTVTTDDITAAASDISGTNVDTLANFFNDAAKSENLSGELREALIKVQQTASGSEKVDILKSILGNPSVAVGNTVSSALNRSVRVIGTRGSSIATSPTITSGVSTGSDTSANHVWGQVVYNKSSQGDEDGVNGYDASTYNALLGYDRVVYDSGNSAAIIGLTLAVAKTDIEENVTNNDSNIKGYHGGIYVAYAINDLKIDVSFLYGFLQYDGSEKIDDVTRKFDTDGRSLAVSGAITYNLLPLITSNMQGFLDIAGRVTYTNISLDDYTTTEAGTLNQKVETDDAGAFMSSLDFTFGSDYNISSTTLSPYITLGVGYFAADKVDYSLRYDFDDFNTVYTTESSDPSSFTYKAGLGAKLEFENQLYLSVDYMYDSIGSLKSHTVGGKIGYKF